MWCVFAHFLTVIKTHFCIHIQSATSSTCKTIEATTIAEWSVDINSRHRALRYNQCKYIEAKSDWKFDFLLNTFIYSLSFCLPICWAFDSHVCILCSISGCFYIYLDKTCGTPRLALTLPFYSNLKSNVRYKNYQYKGIVPPISVNVDDDDDDDDDRKPQNTNVFTWVCVCFPYKEL